MEVRNYQPRDYPGVFNLEVLCFEQHSARQYMDIYVSSPNHFFIAMEEDSVVGYVSGWETDNLGRLISLGVDPSYRCRGIGSALMKRFLNSLSRRVEWLVLEVRMSNSEARRLYEKYGFTVYQVLERYYQDGEDGLLMMRNR